MIVLTRILDQLMQQIATSKRWLDWQKYPWNRKSITIQQPETLESKTCSAFPVMVDDLRLHSFDIELPLRFFFCAKGFNLGTSPHIVFCNGVESGFMARVCTFAWASAWPEVALNSDKAHGTCRCKHGTGKQSQLEFKCQWPATLKWLWPPSCAFTARWRTTLWLANSPASECF